MEDNNKFTDQVIRFHQEIVELIKKYQFRDRNKMVCCGLSVSQCYIIETLKRYGALNMNQLAEKMHLSISTITRVIEPLVKKGFVKREEDPDDRRVRYISITKEGQAVFHKSWKNVFESEKTILSNIPFEQRENLIQLLNQLNKSVNHWQACCSTK